MSESLILRTIWMLDECGCSAPKCRRTIGYGEDCYVNETEVFCDICGPCVRYERKRADARASLGVLPRVINGLEE